MYEAYISIVYTAIPTGYDNEAEMRRVVHLVNHPRIKGFDSGMCKRKFASNPKSRSQKARRRQVRIGRLHELCRRLKRGIKDGETMNLIQKLFGEGCNAELNIGEVENELQQQEAVQKAEEIQDMQDGLNKKGSKLSPSILTEQGVTSTKMQSAEALCHYWKDLWESQKWQEEEIPRKVARMVALLKENFEPDPIKAGRPSCSCFKERLGAIAGCAGAGLYRHTW